MAQDEVDSQTIRHESTCAWQAAGKAGIGSQETRVRIVSLDTADEKVKHTEPLYAAPEIPAVDVKDAREETAPENPALQIGNFLGIANYQWNNISHISGSEILSANFAPDLRGRFAE